MKKNKHLKVSIVMGSQSDYKTMELAEKTLKKTEKTNVKLNMCFIIIYGSKLCII